jgi:hypothetical protein
MFTQTPRQPSSITPEIVEQWELLAKQATPPPLLLASDEKEKPLGQTIVELIFDVGVEVTKKVWKETDPESYALNRAAFALAPYWPTENAWVLNLTALLTTAYGLGQVSERLKKDARNPH